LDDTDWALLRLLELDGRMTNKRLARTVGLSPAACHARVRKLEAVGIIAGYRAVLDWRLLGAGFEAWAEIVLVEADRSEAFAALLVGASAIVSAHRLAQPNVFLVRVAGSSTECWREFLTLAAGEGFALEVARFNLTLASVKPARNTMPARLQRAA
jgi:DNA-binding Lrp family transcriptional regulator